MLCLYRSKFWGAVGSGGAWEGGSRGERQDFTGQHRQEPHKHHGRVVLEKGGEGDCSCGLMRCERCLKSLIHCKSRAPSVSVTGEQGRKDWGIFGYTGVNSAKG